MNTRNGILRGIGLTFAGAWVVFLLGVTIAFLVGWVVNLADVLTQSYDTFGIEEAMEVLGVLVVPLGGVMGWI